MATSDIVVLDGEQMATVLKRYVEILTRKEAHLLEQEGFFNREEHFEAFLAEVRSEFDAHPKIRACFAHRSGAQLCIDFLVGDGEHTRDAASETRRYELSFMSTVLLRTSSVSGVLVREPELLARLLQFIERPPKLDDAVLHYWGKVFRHLCALGTCDEPLVAQVASLVPHVANDSICALLSETLGSLSGTISLLPCLEKGANPLGPLVQTLVDSDAGARNACEVLCAVCVAVTEAQNSAAHGAVWAAIAPVLPRMVEVIFAGAMAAGAAQYPARVEHCLSFLVELLMLHTRVPAEPAPADGGAPLLLAPHVRSLSAMMRSGQTFVQLKAAELLTVALVLVEEHDDDPLATAIVEAGVLPLAVGLFFATDVNGGGRQDFLRHILLRVFCEALACDNAPVHAALLHAEHGALTKTIVHSAERPGERGSVTHTQMALRLVNDACDRVPGIAAMVGRTARWRSAVQQVVGVVPTSLDGIPEDASDEQAAYEPLPARAAGRARGARAASANSENEDPLNSPPAVAAGAAEADGGAKRAGGRPGTPRQVLTPGFESDLVAGLRAQQLDDALDAAEGAAASVPAAAAQGADARAGQIHLGPSSPLLSQGPARSPLAAPNADPNVLVVDDDTYKSSTAPYFDTPQPKLVKRMFYNRTAKAASPFFKSPSAGTRVGPVEAREGADLGPAGQVGALELADTEADPTKALAF